MFEISSNEENAFEKGARIKVIGIGGGGCNAVNTMIRSGLSGVEYIVANTDAQALQASLAPTKVQLGIEITKGLGAGANPEVGRKAALDEYEKLSEVLEDADMVFITAGMGGGTGTGAAPVVAKLSKELGALTVGVVTKPFLFEGKKRFRQAEAGIQSLEENVDSLITIPNQRLLYIAGESLSLVDTFKKADEVLLNAVRGISDLINNTGHINADFADVSTVMANQGLALMGTGVAAGPDRAIKAATEAISSPLLEDITIDGATGIIINVTSSESLTMHETNEAVTLIMEAADEDAEIIFGTAIDDTMEDNIKVTVIATGLGGQTKRVAAPAPQPIITERPAPTMTAAPTPAPTPVVEERVAPVVEPVAPTMTETPVMETAAPIIEETPAPMMEEVTPTMTEEHPLLKEEAQQEESSFVQTIKEAAAKYEASKHISGNTANPATPTRDTHADSMRVNRSKSIAEKLGFISFDEEELDTPAYLRQENGNDSLEERHQSEI